MTRGVEEVVGWVVEEGDPRGEYIGARRTMATVSMEREREAAKRFSRNAGGAIPFDFVEKKKKKGKPVTIHHRESPFFPNDDDSLVRFLISVAVIRFVIFPFRPNRFESSSSLSFFFFLSSFSIHLYSIS